MTVMTARVAAGGYRSAADIRDRITNPGGVRRRVCRYWVSGNCKFGKQCRFLHSWSDGCHGFSRFTQLNGHKKSITGIAISSDKLYTGSTDGTVRIWDCQTGECKRIINSGSEVGCLISAGSWVFVGLLNRIRGWNSETGVEINVNSPNLGQIDSIAIDGDTLFAGAHDGSIAAFKVVPTGNTLSIEGFGSLKGHSKTVSCLKTGAGNRLFSGSRDGSIRVWDTKSLSCLGELKGHTLTVTSLLCYNEFLISGSLDGSIKIWSPSMEEIYSRKEEAAVRALNGVCDAEGKAMLLCSCEDDTVYMYELPSFAEKGRIFSKKTVGTIQTVFGSMFLTGELNGSLTVWNIQEDKVRS